MAVPTEVWGLCIAIVCLMIFIVCYRRRFKQKQMQSAKESNVEMVTIDMKPDTPVEGTPRSDFEVTNISEVTLPHEEHCYRLSDLS